MPVFSDDEDALEIVLDSPGVVWTTGITMAGSGALSITTQHLATLVLLFAGQGALRFPSNEKVAYDVLVESSSFLGAWVETTQLLDVRVLVDADLDK